MNFADERRASGRKMAADRRQSGKDMASERRASGKAFRDDLRALADRETESRALPPAAERPPIPAARGVATYTAPPAASAGGGGIASPLTEVDFALREYHEEGIRSSDGLFTLPSIKKMVMRDANNEQVVLMFAEQDKWADG